MLDPLHIDVHLKFEEWGQFILDLWRGHDHTWLQGEFLIVDVVSSTGVEIRIEREGCGKLRELAVVYSSFADVTGGQVLLLLLPAQSDLCDWSSENRSAKKY